jgi:RNA polymerase sigma-70 factor (ECF subfamily)
MAARRALDLLRKRRPALPIAPDMPAPRASCPDAAAVAAERVSLVRQALTRLPPREAEVFSLRYFGDLSNPDIAELLGTSVGAVALALHKARARLQAILDANEG